MRAVASVAVLVAVAVSAVAAEYIVLKIVAEDAEAALTVALSLAISCICP